MTREKVSEEQSVTVRFGGGINSSAYEQDINALEASSGKNFEIDPKNATFRPRPAFDFIGQAPNNEEIRGMGTLLKRDGTAQFFFQAGNRVYEWAPGKTDQSDCFVDFKYSTTLANILSITEYETVEEDERPQRIATSSTSERYAAALRGTDKRTPGDIVNCNRICIEVQVDDGDSLTAGFIGIKVIGAPTNDGVQIDYNEFTTGDVLGFVVSNSGETEAYLNGSLLRSGDTLNDDDDFYLTFNTTGAPLDVQILAKAGDMHHFYSYNAFDFCVNGIETYTLGFTEIASVDGQARLRGRLEHNWQLDDKVIITDMALREPVIEWDGTSDGFNQVAFKRSSGSDFDLLKAKYCVVSNERAFYANIRDSEGVFPHLLVGSERGDYTVVSTDDRPSSAIGGSDPFFIVHPEIRSINGIVQALNTFAISGNEGSFYNLTGSSSKDYALDELFPRSGATGDEGVVYIGNDIVYGRAGAISSLSRMAELGDVEDADLSIPIKPEIKGYREWNVVYNSREHRVYCFPDTGKEVWVLQKQMVGTEISPWTRFTTQNSFSFQPTTVLNCLDPSDGLEYVFMGDSNGNLYRMEGSSNAQDADADDIIVTRRSKVFSPPVDMRIVNGIEGWVTFRKKIEDVSVNLNLLFSGEAISDVNKTLTLAGLSGVNFYGSGAYYGGSDYYGIIYFNRTARRRFEASGGSTEFQVEVEVEGAKEFEIVEVGLRFLTAT